MVKLDKGPLLQCLSVQIFHTIADKQTKCLTIASFPVGKYMHACIYIYVGNMHILLLY